jgi:SM-20-related protein
VFAAMNLQHYFSELTDQSWCLLPVHPHFAERLLQTAKTKESQFKKAGINESPAVMNTIRSDKIFWLDPENDLADCEKNVLQHFSYLQEELKNYFRVPIKEFECHYSIYEPGQFYARHRDTLKSNNKRVFSFVMYLNPAWNEEDGGQIIGYDGEKVLFRIHPVSGQVLLFRSDLEHEVIPVNRTRYALTGWMRL